MSVQPRDEIRDGSGRYSCPGCRTAGKISSGLVPPTPTCPDCGTSLDWSEAMLLSELRRIVSEMVGELTPILSVPGREINATVAGEDVARWAGALYTIERVRTNR